MSERHGLATMTCSVAAVLSLLLSACSTTPAEYPIPAQFPTLQDQATSVRLDYITMADPTAASFFVQDVGDGGAWRWTGVNPTLRFHISDAADRKLRVLFEISERTFRDTGPLRVAYSVNGVFIERVTYSSPGPKVFMTDLPGGVLRANADNLLSLRVENPWRAPDDGALLGVMLRAAGFVR